MDAAGNPPREMTTVYVGDLDPSVIDDVLTQTFTVNGQTPATVRVCRNSSAPSSLCYAFIRFHSKEQAMEAVKELNHTPMRGIPMRVMLSQREAIKGKIPSANLFVKNLDEAVDGKLLEKMFGFYGNVVSCKVVMENGRSKGFGFVQFEKEEEAEAAVAALNGSLSIGKKKLYVAKFMSKSERTATMQSTTKGCNLYVKNLPPMITDEMLAETFSAFGVVCNAAVMKDARGKSKGFGFVNFKNQEDAKVAMKKLNGTSFGSKQVYVGVAQKKDERKKLLLSQFQENKKVTVVVQRKESLIVEFDRSVDDKSLEELFGAYGKVQSAKVISDGDGNRGFGIVRFSSTQEASKALELYQGNGAATAAVAATTTTTKGQSHEKRPMSVPVISSYVLPKTQAYERAILDKLQGQINDKGLMITPPSQVAYDYSTIPSPASVIDYYSFYMQQQNGLGQLGYHQARIQNHAIPEVFQVDYKMNSMNPQLQYYPLTYDVNTNMIDEGNQYWEPYFYQYTERPHTSYHPKGGYGSNKKTFPYTETPPKGTMLAAPRSYAEKGPRSYAEKGAFNNGQK